MLFNLALLPSFLFASVVLAAPSSRHGAHMTLRSEGRQSLSNNRLEQFTSAASDTGIYSSNWAGALWDEPYGTFTSITGTFTVPLPSGGSGTGASVWVGIDGDTCTEAILQTGVDFMISEGLVWYAAWYEWYPDYAHYFSDIIIGPGDVVKLTVFASSPTTGVATVENLSNGQTVFQNLNSTSALCQQNAEWIVEDFQENGALTPFANFDEVTFADAVATGTGSYTPSGATVVNMKQNGQVLTSVSITGSSVTVQYV